VPRLWSNLALICILQAHCDLIKDKKKSRYPERMGMADPMPKPVEVREGRENVRVYLWFCEFFLEPVIGTAKWRSNRYKLPIRKFVTPSDEAFAIVVYENNYRKWYECYRTKTKPESRTEKALWTSSGERNKNGHTNKKYCGWAREGLEHFNECYKKVEKDRKGVPGFEKKFLKHLLDELAKENKTPKMKKPSTAVDEMEGFQVMTSLPCTTIAPLVEGSDEDASESSSDDDNDSVTMHPV
jgi:hypothetical protein